MTFLNPLDALIPKIPFSLLPDFWVWVTSEAWGSDSVGFWGSCQLSPFWGRGGVRPEGSIDPPPPPETKTRPPLVTLSWRALLGRRRTGMRSGTSPPCAAVGEGHGVQSPVRPANNASAVVGGGGGAATVATMMAADSHTTRRKHQRQPNTQRPVWGQTHHTGTTPTHSHRRPQTGRARKNHRQALGARTRPRQWVGGPVQALRRVPELGPHGRSGPARVAAAAAPHGGSVAHNAEAA